MRILIAPQEFKGTLTAVEAAEAIAAGVRAARPDVALELLPMADGGPGTVEALLAARGGTIHSFRVHDPLMRPVAATLLRLDRTTAVIECAAASGLWRLRPDDLDPRRASSYGTGELVVQALALGCYDLIIGLGGSATNDGGAGLAQALGYRLLDAGGQELAPGCAPLAHLARIDASSGLPELREARCIGATDVTNPLCGPNGASAVFGPQKGADATAVTELDAALAHFAAVIRQDLGVDVSDRPGAGAAGGLGAGLIVFAGAELKSGAELVAQAVGLDSHIRRADLVITGEGRLDGQTAFGKATQYVARRAKAAGRPVVCLAGSLGPGHEALLDRFDLVETTGEGTGAPTPDLARSQLAEAARRALLRLADQRVGV